MLHTTKVYIVVEELQVFLVEDINKKKDNMLYH